MSLRLLKRNRFFRFLLVGFTSVITDFIVYKLLIFFHLPYPIAKAVSFSTGAICSFQLNRIWTFGDTASLGSKAAKFSMLYLSGLALNLTVNHLFILILPSDFASKINLAFIFATCASAMFNYLGMKTFVFVSSDNS